MCQFTICLLFQFIIALDLVANHVSVMTCSTVVKFGWVGCCSSSTPSSSTSSWSPGSKQMLCRMQHADTVKLMFQMFLICRYRSLLNFDFSMLNACSITTRAAFSFLFKRLSVWCSSDHYPCMVSLVGATKGRQNLQWCAFPQGPGTVDTLQEDKQPLWDEMP